MFRGNKYKKSRVPEIHARSNLLQVSAWRMVSLYNQDLSFDKISQEEKLVDGFFFQSTNFFKSFICRG